MSGRRGSWKALAILALLFLAGLTLPGPAGAACEISVTGRLVSTPSPLWQTQYVLYDLVHAPGSEPFVSPYDGSQARDAAGKRVLHAGATDAAGNFTVCLSSSDSTALDGTIDLVLSARAESPVATVRTPGLASRSVEVLTGHGFAPMSSEPSWVYTSYTGESRNVAPGPRDYGSYVPAGPSSPMGPPPQAPGEPGPNLCFDRDMCLDRWLVPLQNPTGTGFYILGLMHVGHRFVRNVEARAFPERAPGAPSHVEVYYQQQACGGGCYLGGTITILQATDATILHEYGHHVHAQFGSNQSPGGDHHCSSNAGDKLAWGEGFADFFPAFSRANRFGSSCNDAETAAPSPFGQANEGNVVRALWDLQDDTPAEDALAGSPEKFWKVFTSHPRNYGNYRGFHDRWVSLFPADEPALRAVACQNGMAFEWC